MSYGLKKKKNSGINTQSRYTGKHANKEEKNYRRFFK